MKLPNPRLATLCLSILFGLASVSAQDEERANARPLKVFILAGQSNMQGHAHVRTFERIGLDEATAPLLRKMRNADGTPRVLEDVWISSLGSADEVRTGKLTVGYGAAQRGPKIGPEFTFGIYLRELLDEPFLIIKTAWGGKSLHTDFRPPSAGPYAFREDQIAALEKRGQDVAKVRAEKEAATGRFYRLMIEHVRNVLRDLDDVVPAEHAERGYELAGFVWFQGWNDMVDGNQYPQRGKPGGYEDYSRLLAAFIHDVRKDLEAPGLPFVIGVMGVGGDLDRKEPTRHTPVHRSFREAMAAPATLPEFRSNVRAVRTGAYWDHELSDLREKERELRKDLDAQRKAGELSEEDHRKRFAERRAKAFTERELAVLDTGASNAEFHYLGSALILGGIGKGFAEAMFEMVGER